MEKQKYLIVLFSFTFHLFSLFIVAQNIIQVIPSYNNGYTKIPFKTDKGEITVFLPDNLKQGDPISATAKIVPKEGSISKQTTSLNELKHYTLQIGDSKIPLINESFSFILETNSLNNLSVSLLNNEGKKIAETQIKQPPYNPNHSKNCSIPSHALVGEPVCIYGNFDGNASNTICNLNGKPVTVLAESPSQCALVLDLSYPKNTVGKQQLSVQEENQPECTDSISTVNMQLSTGKLNLIKGEHTWIEINITGLDNLTEIAKLSVINQSKNIITLEGGNNQLYTLKPETVNTITKKDTTQSWWYNSDNINVYNNIEEIKTNQNTFSKHLAINSLQTGSYLINVDLELPENIIDSTGPVQYENGPTTPTKPGGDGQIDFKCDCHVTVTAKLTADKGKKMFFNADVSAECKSVCGKGVNTVTVCNPGDTELSWYIKEGKDNAKIVGPANKDKVEVARLNNGAFIVAIKATLSCCGGTKCSAETEIPIPESPNTEETECGISIEEYNKPPMDGRLIAEYVMKNREINRDDYIALGAEGKDYDLLELICDPINPCKEVRGVKRMNLNGRVKFEWNIMPGGGGSFVKIGQLPQNLQMDEGDRVIFKPPYVPLPNKVNDTSSIITKVFLYIIDDNPGQAQDPTVNREITIITKRVDNKPDKYIVSVIPKESPKILPKPNPEDENNGTCKVIAKPWIIKSDLTLAPVIQVPKVAGSDTIVNGEWVILNVVNQRDIDSLLVKCESTTSKPPCTTNGMKLGYGDNIKYVWSIAGDIPHDKSKGKFIKSNTNEYQFVDDTTGGTILYQAPTDLGEKDFVTVTIKCKAVNPEANRVDKESPIGTINLKIYKGGVKLSPTPIEWLPKYNDSVKITSTLCVSDTKDKWLVAPMHFGRTHFFELSPVSNEKGICMNDPLVKANECRDLKLANDTISQEAYDSLPIKTCPDNRVYFVKARTANTEHDYAINVFCEDYGAYGYLASFADCRAIQKDTKTVKTPLYKSVPLQKGEAKHPGSFKGGSGSRDGSFEFSDNRVSIPQDLDKNNIADFGYVTGKGKELADPPFAITDEDTIPEGDNFKGDGLTNYEEYRGFMTLEKPKRKEGETGPLLETTHIRSHYDQKTLFIYADPPELDIELFTKITNLETYKIGNGQFKQPDKVSYKKEGTFNSGVWINYNFTNAQNIVKQYGLFLKDFLVNKDKPELHGIALNISPKESERTRPSAPNWEFQIRIFSEAIKKYSTENNLNEEENKSHVIAHELLHGCNVCHHGEKLKDSDDYDLPEFGGLRSGNIDCVMRYDNMTDGKKFPIGAPELPEKIGDALCTSYVGTGYNEHDTIKVNGNPVIHQNGMGDAALNRGDCAHQIRISMRGGQPPECRQNERRKKIGDIIK